jgi:hypothetical protein
MEVDRADGADREYNMSEAVKAVKTCHKLSGQDGTCLGLLLLYVGPNGDGFGGQKLMEHYSTPFTIQITLILLIFLHYFLIYILAYLSYSFGT